MSRSLLMVGVLCLVVTTGAFAQAITPRALGMGTAQTGVADDAAAWFYNPAGLAALNVPVPEGKEWGHDALGFWSEYKIKSSSYADPISSQSSSSSSSWNTLGGTWSGWRPDRLMGVGAGVVDIEDTSTSIGAGIGWASKSNPLSWGLSLVHHNPDNASGKLLVDIGVMYRFAQPNRAPIRLGLVGRDVTDQYDFMLDFGAAVPATEDLLIAIDVLDVTGSSPDGPYVNGGVEYTMGRQGEWKLRAGINDTGSDRNLCLGAGYNWTQWRMDIAWSDIDSGDLWSLGLGRNF